MTGGEATRRDEAPPGGEQIPEDEQAQEDEQARGEEQAQEKEQVGPGPGGLRALADLLRPRVSPGQLVGGLLCLVLGFAVAAQVRSTERDTTFATARQDELVGILADLGQRSERLRGDLRDLEETKARLERDAEGGTALQEARERATAYGLLAGTLPAEGPGIELRIDDPGRGVKALNLLDALEELRDAGAEVIQVGDVRVGVDTHFLDERDGIRADGRLLTAPYRFLAIGDPHTMTTALGIPGGLVRTLEGAGAHVLITRRAKVAVGAVRSP
ncbi:DUF881 domain-containing protein [Actinomadura luteofluorescens]|uniref:Uncharacterized protein YlxW (UPF0749 family) n=1 Tax=Actinomadura luteofluorescens TaxID=46163 RepID=A0A7Y9JL86_9ACTN|nr:DUF881 domain-containing protein [Actinomadura luteofluorescens]NYD52686.1 uncharacterized protein YlxW (UPF0749 family) [Actinomadura luteofluorescens]